MKIWKRWKARRKARQFLRQEQYACALATLYEAYGADGATQLAILQMDEDMRNFEGNPQAKDFVLALVVYAVWAILVWLIGQRQ
jgi:hypothetical protein